MVVNAARPGRVQSPDDESEGRGVEKRRSSASAAVRRPAVKWRRGNVKGAWGGQGRAGKGEVRAQDGKSVAIAYGQGKKPEIASFAIRLQFSPFPRHFRGDTIVDSDDIERASERESARERERARATEEGGRCGGGWWKEVEEKARQGKPRPRRRSKARKEGIADGGRVGVGTQTEQRDTELVLRLLVLVLVLPLVVLLVGSLFVVLVRIFASSGAEDCGKFFCWLAKDREGGREDGSKRGREEGGKQGSSEWKGEQGRRRKREREGVARGERGRESGVCEGERAEREGEGEGERSNFCAYVKFFRLVFLFFSVSFEASLQSLTSQSWVIAYHGVCPGALGRNWEIKWWFECASCARRRMQFYDKGVARQLHTPGLRISPHFAYGAPEHLKL
ncbi:hypothetical protein AXG93_4689s1440 [Marchantia polymorpha subsp. ruderalis]|uniref:Uncharacterized protein n=1 Tax=Marchantia polymorpha subsp. ruderalis TaxID=1480154 RepID=A0A176WKH1_MARPO|nr:hypothetical protein AXG93_4689s1440 [Marchantia polymorpha subsp. ruderalis]